MPAREAPASGPPAREAPASAPAVMRRQERSDARSMHQRRPGKRQRRAGRHAEAGAKRRPEHASAPAREAPASGRPSCGGRSEATPGACDQRRPGKRQRRAGRHAEAGAKRRPEHAINAGPGSASVGPAVMRRQERSDARSMRSTPAREAPASGRPSCGGRSEATPGACISAGPGSASVGPAVMRRQERSDARSMHQRGRSRSKAA